MSRMVMCDPARVTGTCVECRRGGLPGSAFIASDLAQFLEEQSGARKEEFSDIRADMRAQSAIEVQGGNLRCRDCSLVARDAADAASGRCWRSPLAEVTFATRPFGMTRSARFHGYIVEAVDRSRTKPALMLGVASGWRVARVRGADCRGEPSDAVQARLRAAELPLTVGFEVPEEEWVACSGCGLSFPCGQLSPDCAICVEERRFGGGGADDAATDSWDAESAEHAAAAAAAAAVAVAEAEARDAATESWEDLF